MQQNSKSKFHLKVALHKTLIGLGCRCPECRWMKPLLLDKFHKKDRALSKRLIPKLLDEE